MKTHFRRVTLALLSALFAATTSAATTANATSVLAGIDRSVVPGSDFFGYANGAWLKNAQIPADLPSYGASEKLIELNEHRVVDLIRVAASKPSDASVETRQVADYYAAFMDEAAIEARGLAGLAPTMQRINAISDRTALARYLGTTLRADVDILNATNLYSDNVFGLWVAQDLDDPSRYLPFLLQGGLGMPDRDYYLNDSPQMADDRSHYQAYIATVLELSGESDADQKAVKVLALERSIAQSWREKQRDAALRQQIVTDPHAPSQYRAVTCRNLDAWYTAFHVTKGQSLYLPPMGRVRMW
ncbi:MAG TPA: M13-type metalloendopeptidase [Steroidobacteraceae bacterium]|jgi:putative endopeptidase|nr:M13-type metalloendopeptidase [Steroidobacteraceae bacterium]